MKIDKHIKDLIQSSDLDCIKLGLVYLKQDLDKCDEYDKHANYLRNYYYHIMKRLRNFEKLSEYRQQTQLSYLTAYIHYILNLTI